MFALTRILTTRQLLIEQVPVLAVSLLIAEMWYKFHSFTLETLAFLATWYIIGACVRAIIAMIGPRRPGTAGLGEVHE
jgi:hypothetical protein